MKLQWLVGKYFFAFCFATWDQVSSGFCNCPCRKYNNPKIGDAYFFGIGRLPQGYKVGQ